MSLALYPSIRLGKTEQKIRESISRLSTGLNVLAGATGGDFAQATGLKLEANSYGKLASAASVGQDLLLAAESALVELASLASRLREIGIADTASTNSASDTAALNAEAIAVSDTIDDIVTSLTVNNIALLGTSARTYNIPKDVYGNTTAIKTTNGITATNISDATGANTTADTALGEITTSMGHVAGHLKSMQAISNVSDTIEAIELQAAARLIDTKFAVETAKLMKNQLINKYAHSMVAKGNESEKDKLMLII